MRRPAAATVLQIANKRVIVKMQLVLLFIEVRGKNIVAGLRAAHLQYQERPSDDRDCQGL